MKNSTIYDGNIINFHQFTFNFWAQSLFHIIFPHYIHDIYLKKYRVSKNRIFLQDSRESRSNKYISFEFENRIQSRGHNAHNENNIPE